jgi:hypothetical protein
MKQIVYSILVLGVCFSSFGQDKIGRLTKPIVDEGKKLYRSEMASWHGTDIFLEQFKDRTKIGGYFSYTENDVSKCIFFSKTRVPRVIGTISFDSTYDITTATTDLTEREFTKTENELFLIRSNAFKIINSDTIFKVYKNTNLNLVPLISNGEKKVYVLTGAQDNGVVIFGNDYLLTFDDDNKLISRSKLHKNIIYINYGERTEDGKEITGAMHTHLPGSGDFITATDICTLMLYEKLARWQQHTVVSANYISIWNCKTNELVAITKEIMDRINKEKEKRNKKDKDKPE